MACINSSGELSPTAKKILAVLEQPARPEEVARTTGLPLFRIRSGLREMKQAGLVEERSGAYAISATGRALGEQGG